MAKINQEEILHETREDEAANLNPRTRIVGMKWVKLGEGKDPEWGVSLFLYRRVGDKDCYAVGELHKIESLKDGKQYEFLADNQEPDTFTHWAQPTVPK